MKNKRYCWIVFLAAVLMLLLQSCSRPATNIDNLVSCENGTNPTPIDSEFDFPGDLLFVKRDKSEILAFNGKTHQFTSIFHLPNNGTADVSPTIARWKDTCGFLSKPFGHEKFIRIGSIPSGNNKKWSNPFTSIRPNSRKNNSVGFN